MNIVILSGRLTRDPEIRYAQSNGQNVCFAEFCIAIDRESKNDEGADFITCTTAGKNAENIERFFRKGSKIIITNGRWQTGNFTNKDGKKIYTNKCYVNKFEFGDSKNSSSDAQSYTQPQNNQAPAAGNDFMSIPDDIDESFPFQ